MKTIQKESRRHCGQCHTGAGEKHSGAILPTTVVLLSSVSVLPIVSKGFYNYADHSILCPESHHSFNFAGNLEISRMLHVRIISTFSRYLLTIFSDIGRTLNGDDYTDAANMTVESCIAFCGNSGFNYAGTEYSSQCCEFLFQNLQLQK